jgi:hypothetical protein
MGKELCEPVILARLNRLQFFAFLSDDGLLEGGGLGGNRVREKDECTQ